MSTSKVPQLPITNDSEASSLRYEVNPAIALNALADIYKQVQKYQVQLRQLAQNIHQVYAEGPVVSGWLASEASLNAAVKQITPTMVNYDAAKTAGAEHNGVGVEVSATTIPQQGEIDVALFRHGDANDLMNYLSALENSIVEQQTVTEHAVAPQLHHPTETQTTSSHYYLCQLDSSGQIQAEPCPPEQVPVLSMAIARYRRLNQLIKQKQKIESKLQAIVDILGNAQQVLAD
ncbi:MAG: hypothetical protein AAF579_12220 [Cyanobacteria bacterium P01_C01_bin.118]